MCFCENNECPYHEINVEAGKDSVSVYKAVIPGFSNDFYRIKLERHEEAGGVFLCSMCHNAVKIATKALHTSMVRQRRKKDKPE